MDFLLTLLLLLNNKLDTTHFFQEEKKIKNVSVSNKKKHFLSLMVVPVEDVHQKLMNRYERVLKTLADGNTTVEIENLKKEYRAKDNEDLLARLKPHPVSITLAQAAMESSWATSRFFKEANNVFGMWSSNSREKRIAAAEKRDGNTTIWLRRFDTIEDSIRAYYELISKAKPYAKFRKLRLESDNPYIITQGLDKYSELGQTYVNKINSVIRHNNFTKYDK